MKDIIPGTLIVLAIIFIVLSFIMSYVLLEAGFKIEVFPLR